MLNHNKFGNIQMLLSLFPSVQITMAKKLAHLRYNLTVPHSFENNETQRSKSVSDWQPRANTHSRSFP